MHHAIVWQDRRAEPACAQLREQGKADTIQSKTGLLIDAYFSGTKLQWLLDNVPGARESGRAGRTGLWHGRQLADLATDPWPGARDGCEQRRAHHAAQRAHQPVGRRTAVAAAHSKALMPEVLPSSAHFGDIVADLLGHAIRIGGGGDQQSALFGQACFTAGMAKNTYGHGLLHAHAHGPHVPDQPERPADHQRSASHHAPRVRHGRQRVLSAAPWCSGCATACAPSPAAARSNPGTVCARFRRRDDGAGLSPAWAHRTGNPDARGTITGLTRGNHTGPIARAALESIAYQSAALLLAMSRDAVPPVARR